MAKTETWWVWSQVRREWVDCGPCEWQPQPDGWGGWDKECVALRYAFRHAPAQHPSGFLDPRLSPLSPWHEIHVPGSVQGDVVAYCSQEAVAKFDMASWPDVRAQIGRPPIGRGLLRCTPLWLFYVADDGIRYRVCGMEPKGANRLRQDGFDVDRWVVAPCGAFWCCADHGWVGPLLAKAGAVVLEPARYPEHVVRAIMEGKTGAERQIATVQEATRLWRYFGEPCNGLPPRHFDPTYAGGLFPPGAFGDLLGARQLRKELNRAQRETGLGLVVRTDLDRSVEPVVHGAVRRPQPVAYCETDIADLLCDDALQP